MENNKNENLYLLPNHELNTGRLFMFMYNCLSSVYEFRGKYNQEMLLKTICSQFPEAREIYRYEIEYVEKPDDEDDENEELRDFMTNKVTSYILELEKMVLCEICRSDISIYYKKPIQITKYIEVIRKHSKKTEKKPTFNLIVNSSYGGSSLDIEEFEIRKQDISISENYNNDFQPVNERMINFLQEDKKSGLIVLHGKHGTGKTSYIRYLISHVEKKFIYLPSYLANEISSPHFIPFIKDYKNCILIIEDCEEIIKSRKAGNTSGAIENLLNMGDGLLSDALFLKVICTFNTDLKNIDQALLRKGRLRGRYEFKELDTEKVQNLFIKNNIQHCEPKPMTLAEVYNITDGLTDESLEFNKIGFGAN